MLEYTPALSGERWHVQRFANLVAEFELVARAVLTPALSHPMGEEEQDLRGWQSAMRLFHEIGDGYARGWFFVRRLFGVGPLVPDLNSHPDDLRVWQRPELCAQFGLEADELQAELDALRILWRRSSAGDEPEKPSPLIPLPSDGRGAAEGTLQFGDEILVEFGFADRMFDVEWYDTERKCPVKREPQAGRLEKIWFTQRVGQWQRMLREPMASTLARQALVNELQLRRIEEEVCRIPATERAYEKLQGTKRQLEETFQVQLTKLGEMFPEFGDVANKVSFRACIADLFAGRRDYYAKGDNRLMDRVRTAAELEVDLRQSVQDPEVRHRAGLNVYIIESIAGLHDPNWRSQLKPSVLGKLDKGFKAAVNAAREAANEPLVDLEKDGQAGEYPDLIVEGEEA